MAAFEIVVDLLASEGTLQACGMSGYGRKLGTDIICSHPRTDVEILFLLEVGQFVVLKPKQSKAHCNSER